MAILTRCTLTFIDLNEIHIGTVPTNPTDNQLWFDTVNNLLKKYNSSLKIWEIINDYTQDIIDALENLQVSSRNLLASTSYESQIICSGTTNKTGGQYNFVKTINYINHIKDKEITLAFDWEIVVTGTPSGTFRTQTTGNEITQIGDIITLSNSNYYGTCVFTTTLTTASSITGINFRTDGVTGTFKITHPRLFYGSKDLGWTQAPEDTQAQFETIINKQAEGVYISVADKDNNIKSLVTFDSKKVVINSTNIDLQGYVTISSLSDPSSTTTIDGNLIETDTLSANKVKTGKLQGKNSNSYFNLDNGTFSLANSTQSLMTFNGTSLTFQNNVNYNLDKDDFSSNLDWIKSWTEDATVINSKQVMSPRAFFGSVNASKQASGISIGGALNKIYETEGIYSGIDDGLAGYKLGTKMFHLKTDGTLLIGPNTTGNHISWDGSNLSLRASSMNIGINSVATNSNVSSAVNALQLKFTQSSGYNLIRNSTGASGDTSGWTHNATSMSIGSNDSTGSNCKSFLYLDNGTTTSEKYAYSSRFKLKPSTKYTLTGYFHNYTACPSFDVWLLSSTTLSETDITTSYTNAQALITGQTTSGTWEKFTTTITTPASTLSGYIRIDNNGYNSSGTGLNRIHWNALMLTEGELETPWSPHPSELYDGITFIDKDGISVTASNVKSKTSMSSTGFKITKTDTSEDVFSVNSDGTLTIKSNLTGGSINLSNKFIVDSLGNVTTAGSVTLGGTVTASNLKLTGGSINLSNKFIVDSSGNVITSGNVTLGGTVTANNLSLNSGSINLANKFTVDSSGNVITSGNVTLGGTVTANGNITATNLKLNGGSININSGKFTVDSSGNVIASNLSLTGGSININNGKFIVDSQGNVTTAGSVVISSEATVPVGTLQGTISSSQLDTTINNTLTSANSNNTLITNNNTKWSTAYNQVNNWTLTTPTGTTEFNGNRIKTGTILAEKIAIGDFTNYAELNTDTLSKWGFTSETDSSASNNPWFKKTTISRDNPISRYYECNGGETLRIKADISTTIYGQNVSGGTETATAKSVGIMIFAKSNTGTISYLTNDDLRVIATSTSTATVATVNSTITLGNDAREFAAYVQINGYPTFSGEFKLRNVSVNKMSNGELIVDGSITSSSIDTDAVRAEHIYANSINSEHVDINGNGFTFYASKTLNATTNAYEYGDTIFSIKTEQGQNSSVSIKPDSFILNGRNSKNTSNASIILKDNILTIDASAITTGTLDASLITTGTLDASLINAKAIKGSQINAEDFTVTNNTTGKSTFVVKGGKVYVSASDFIVTSEAFNIDTLTENSSLSSELSKEKDRIDKYIRFNSGTIELGEVSGNYKATLTNTALTFFEKGSAVSWIRGNTMYMTNNRSTDSLEIGPTSGGGYYKWDYQDNGHLNLNWFSN